MNILLKLAYLFFIGSTLGWVVELLFRRFFSAANPEHKWINPGFCVGPYVPLYGFGLCILYLFASMGDACHIATFGEKALLVLGMAVSMTVIEYLAGIFCLKLLKIRLWDYSNRWGNIQGLICPLFSLFWAAISVCYYLLVHPRILDALSWLADNLAFSFVIGFFFGVFTIDVAYSAQLVMRIKRFADENQVIVKYENLKAHIRSTHDKIKERAYFLFPFHSSRSLLDNMREAKEALEMLKHK